MDAHCRCHLPSLFPHVHNQQLKAKRIWGMWGSAKHPPRTTRGSEGEANLDELILTSMIGRFVYLGSSLFILRSVFVLYKPEPARPNALIVCHLAPHAGLGIRSSWDYVGRRGTSWKHAPSLGTLDDH